MKESNKNYTGLWMAVSCALGIWFYVYAKAEPRRIIDAVKNGGSLWYQDTVYIYKPAIEKKYYRPQEIEPKEDPH